MSYSCSPMSRKYLRSLANRIRSHLKQQNTIYFPVKEFLERLHQIVDDEDFYVDVRPVSSWKFRKSVHAYYDVSENCICIREDVYDGACDGNGRDRMTVMHECCHVILIKWLHVKLTRCFGAVKPYEDPEWQAKCLAGELMVPSSLVQGMRAEEVADRCGVSISAARYQLRKNKESNRNYWRSPGC